MLAPLSPVQTFTSPRRSGNNPRSVDMEHRWNVRTPIRLNVVVQSNGIGMISGKTRDLSFGGTYVETAPSVSVRRNSIVKLSMPVAGDMRTVSAMVVRTAPTGFGLMFTDFELDTFSLLDMLLRCGSAGVDPDSGLPPKLGAA
jgi:hypothetical protein